MTLSVLEGHSPIASRFKCDISYCGASRSPSASAELLVINRHGHGRPKVSVWPTPAWLLPRPASSVHDYRRWMNVRLWAST